MEMCAKVVQVVKKVRPTNSSANKVQTQKKGKVQKKPFIQAYEHALKDARNGKLEDALRYYAIGSMRLRAEIVAKKISADRAVKGAKEVRAKISDAIILSVLEERAKREKIAAQVKAANKATGKPVRQKKPRKAAAKSSLSEEGKWNLTSW